MIMKLLQCHHRSMTCKPILLNWRRNRLEELVVCFFPSCSSWLSPLSRLSSEKTLSKEWNFIIDQTRGYANWHRYQDRRPVPVLVRVFVYVDLRPATFGLRRLGCLAGRLIRRLRARTPALVSRLKPKSRWEPNRSFRGNPLDELPQNGIHCLRQFRRHGPKQLGYSFFKKGERKT